MRIPTEDHVPLKLSWDIMNEFTEVLDEFSWNEWIRGSLQSRKLTDGEVRWLITRLGEILSVETCKHELFSDVEHEKFTYMDSKSLEIICTICKQILKSEAWKFIDPETHGRAGIGDILSPPIEP